MVRGLAVLAVLALAAQWGAVHAGHLGDDSQIVTEHGRIQLLKNVADLALLNLNEVEKPTEPWEFGRLIEVSQDTAVRHRYKSIVPRGLGIKIFYEARQSTAKRSAVCEAEVILSLTSEFSVDSNKCNFYVKAGDGSGKESPTDVGVKQDLSLAAVRSAGAALGEKYHVIGTVKDGDTIYMCTARSFEQTYATDTGVSYYVTASLNPNCDELIEPITEVFRNHVDEYTIMEPAEPPVDISIGLKFGIAIICGAVWVFLYFYHIHLVKKDIKLKIEERQKAEDKKRALEAKKNQVVAADSEHDLNIDGTSVGKSD